MFPNFCNELDGMSYGKFCHIVGKWFGNCNELKRELDECFYLEKKAKQGENLRKAREFDAKFEEMLKKGTEKQDS